MKRVGKYITQKSLRQYLLTIDSVIKHVEDLECGHTISTPFTSVYQEYRVGQRRVCKSCTKSLEDAEREERLAAKKPTSTLDELSKQLNLNLIRFPLNVEVAGVYFLMRNDRIMYVGKSVNLVGRLGNQIKRYKRKFDSILFASVHVRDLDRTESTLIRALRPKLNRSIPHESRAISRATKMES